MTTPTQQSTTAIAKHLSLLVGLTLLFGSAAGAKRPAKPRNVARAALEKALKPLKTKKAPSADALTEAKDDAERALLALRDAAPMRVREAILIDGAPGGVSVYTPLKTSTIPGRTVNIYLEVEGFGALERSDGLFDTQLEVVGTFAFEDGTALGDKSLGNRRVLVHRRQGIAAFATDLSLSDKAPAGTYTVDVKVKCVHTGRTASKRITFTLPRLVEGRAER